MSRSDSAQLASELLELRGDVQRNAFLHAHRSDLSLEVADELKLRVDHLMRTDQARASETADLILHIARLTKDPRQEAVGLLAKANVHLVATLEFERAVKLFDRAGSVYQSLELPVLQARSQIGRVAALANLGRYAEAVEAGEQAYSTLQQHEEWDLLIGLSANLGMAYGHSGDDAKSLELFDRALEIHSRLSRGIDTAFCLIEINRSFALRALGRFSEAVAAGESAIDALDNLEISADAARAREHLAVTYFVMGYYNEALDRLDQAREGFLADDRIRDAILVDLFRSDCLLELRRFVEVRDLSKAIQIEFQKMGSLELAAQALINQAAATAGLGRFSDALHALERAEAILEDLEDPRMLRATRLKAAAILLTLGRYRECLDISCDLARHYAKSDLEFEAAQASLLAGQAALSLKDFRLAEEWLERASTYLSTTDLPALSYRGHMLRGRLKAVMGDREHSLRELDRAIEEFERLRGRVMLEHRVRFQEDKDEVYADAVRLAVELDQADQALDYAERAKSRALVELVAHRVELSIEPRSADDQHLVDRLIRLRDERDRSYRRWEGELRAGERGTPVLDENDFKAHGDALALERQITETWHRLLVRNADYARDASLWKVTTEPIQPELEQETTLLEFFHAGQDLVAFVVTRDAVQAQIIRVDLDRVHDLIRLLWLNLSSIPTARPTDMVDLRSNANGILDELHSLLLGPVENEILEKSNLIVVPHGQLHYVPFHALRVDGAYLVETNSISYLPASSVLPYCRRGAASSGRALAVGISSNGALPHAVLEANSVAELLGGESLLESRATRDRVLQGLRNTSVLHLATHGEFRSDNPLFSGLVLADGWLTALDVFGLQWSASLVTLSACETGQNVIGGGDELLGLTRALLAAGSASLLLTLWAVEDESTPGLMTQFYRALLLGETKADALRSAQLALLRNELSNVDLDTSHPYYWAPFVLIGDRGNLPLRSR